MSHPPNPYPTARAMRESARVLDGCIQLMLVQIRAAADPTRTAWPAEVYHARAVGQVRETVRAARTYWEVRLGTYLHHNIGTIYKGVF